MIDFGCGKKELMQFTKESFNLISHVVLSPKSIRLNLNESCLT